jgi:hypothetical protein
VTDGTLTITVPASTATPTDIPGPISACNSGVPAYATNSCTLGNTFQQYSSACSCAGATGATATGDAPTVTATVTKTVPASVVYVVATALP